jgi:membrane protease YdiL (CAAX protease family)
VRDRHGVALGAIVSAVLFGVIHYVPGPWPDAVALQVTMVVTGIGLALVYERRKTLLAPIVGHAAFNLIAVVVIVFDALR